MVSPILKFFKTESAGGVCLLLAAVIATFLENSPLQGTYRSILQTQVSIGFGSWSLNKPAILWIDDLLMAFFFLLVGLELKREAVVGELKSFKKVLLPAVAAIGGMVAPALIFMAINWKEPTHYQGWAIPAATDIAFSLAVLSVLGRRVPHSLRIFLTSLAIFDDLGAILIIALFYTANLSIIFLLAACGVFLLLVLMNRRGVVSLLPYLILGIPLWLFTLKSGIHATIAGVLLALVIPLHSNKYRASPLKKLEHVLHPWISFLVLPVFAFANGALSFHLLSLSALTDPLALGVLCGLFFGKQLGVFLTSYLAVKMKWAELPSKSNWGMLYGISIITGIGFTMSLFIGALAFKDPQLIDLAKTGTIVGSLMAAVVGYILISVYSKTKPA